MTFHTYYWHDVPMDSPEFDHARTELASPASEAIRVRAFLTLLHSDRTAAIGTALDHYDYADSSSRHGSDNPFAAHADEVLQKARQLLRQPPLPAAELGTSEDGVNHASALGAMLNLAQSDDADLIAAALEGATGPSARATGLAAGRTAMENSAIQNPRLVTAVSKILFDPESPRDERIAALRALGSNSSDETDNAVLRALESEDLYLQIHAAFILAHRDTDRYRELLEPRVLAWPIEAPYPASDVIDLLHEDQ